MAALADIDSLLGALRQELQARDSRLGVWYSDNEKRIKALTRLISLLASRERADQDISTKAELALQKAKSLVVSTYPDQVAWFDTNVVLLRLISLRILVQAASAKVTAVSALEVPELIVTFRPQFMSSEPPAGYESAIGDLVGRADRIEAYLAQNGVSPPLAAELVEVDAKALRTELRRVFRRARKQQNDLIATAAQRLNESADEVKKTALTVPKNPSDSDLRGTIEAAAASSPYFVAGFVLVASALRAELEARIAAIVQSFGGIDDSWTFATTNAGTLPIEVVPQPSRNVLLGKVLGNHLALELATPGLPKGELPSESDLLTVSQRTAANVAAIHLLVSGEPYSSSQISILKSYSGWGGLSLDKVRDKLPPAFLPEQRALIHEYYTPSAVAEAIALLVKQRLPLLSDGNGVVKALEPSAGLGRLIRAASGDGYESLQWSAVEYSKVSAAILRAVRPDVSVYEGPFESFVQANLHERGLYQLVLSNPPYGERGVAASLDPDRAYKERSAWLYQMRRSLEYLQAGGLGVYLIPAGFMTGTGKASREARRKILLVAHLLAAFRLPSIGEDGKPLFPGALLVTDIVFLQARGGQLPDVAEDDELILAGDYFKRYPSHILGRELGRNAEDDNQGKKPRFGYQVKGDFNGIPSFEDRPICRDCAPIVFEYERRPKTPDIPPLDEKAQDALGLARRVSAYLSDVSRADQTSTARAKASQPELRRDLLSWHSQDQDEIRRISTIAKKYPSLQPLFTAVPRGKLIAAIDTAPDYVERFQGNPDDIPALATFLHGSRLDTTPPGILSYHRGLGGQKTEAIVRAELAAAGFAIDEGAVIPATEYYTGSLWEKYDRASQLAQAGDEIAAIQAARLLELIRPANFAELEVDLRLGWLPIEAISAFVSQYSAQTLRDGSQYEVVRDGPLLTLRGVPYDSLPFFASAKLVELLGYMNHDLVYFKPERRRDESIEHARTRRAAEFREAFSDWIESNSYWQREIANAFNRKYRGWLTPSYPKSPLTLARWSESKPLFGYQWAGVRRLNANHGGGLFYDVGLGKTRTILAALALARQDGWARRQVVVVPNSVVFNWIAEIERVLPDYRVVVIGIKRKAIKRGPRRGELDTETDTPRERAEKWQQFKAGLYDVAILTYSSLTRTAIRREKLVEIVRQVPAIRREVGLQGRTVQLRVQQLEKKSRLTPDQANELKGLRERYKNLTVTERRAAIDSEREEAFAADIVTLPPGQEFDPGVYWEDLGIDWIAFDESHIAKNLWTAGPREGGSLKFLGAPQEASGIALQVFFRAAIVRELGGSRGVHLADATPAKNSPLEFLSLLSFLDDRLWERLGVFDSEQYITQFLKIESRLVTDTDLSVVEAPCVVGFKNLDQLREVLFRYGEFRTAAEVGLRIPKPEVYQIEVDMDSAQEAKYSQYIKEYTTAISNAGRSEAEGARALGLLARMSLVAVHSKLDEPPGQVGWNIKNYREVGDYTSPKLLRIAGLIAQRRNCGHLVFFENTVSHYWLREILVDLGMPRERIGILNGEVTPSPLARQKVAEGFTSESPQYDVVIANRVAYEGLNLQVRTCAIYHGDLPWEPATLQQRNGRGLRQGNKYEVIEIYYVLSARSMDGARFELIRGKREWMAELIESAASESNNPAAQTNMSPEEWLIFLSRDKEQTRLLIESRKASIKADADARQVKLAWAAVRSISLRHRDLQNADAVMRARIAEQISKYGNDLESIDGSVWPWKFIISAITANPVLSFAPKSEGAVWTGARYTRRGYDGSIRSRGEFGRVIYESRQAIGFRRYGSVQWNELTAEESFEIWEETEPGDWTQQFDITLAEEIAVPIQALVASIKDEGVWAYRQARFDLATEEFRLVASKYVRDIASAIRSSELYYQARLPLIKDGTLINDPELIGLAEVIAFTDAGFERFLLLAVASNLKWTEINTIADWWWGRSIPRNLLTQADKQLRAA